jgi:general secretion pathway protein G
VARRASEQRVLFPWDGSGTLRRLFGTGRLRPILLLLAVFVFVLWVGMRERERSGVRQTRATLLRARSAVDGYMADHDGGCPPNVDAVVPSPNHGRDAWGRPLRLVCPTDRLGYTYELLSDGPDGEPGGLDRIE